MLKEIKYYWKRQSESDKALFLLVASGFAWILYGLYIILEATTNIKF